MGDVATTKLRVNLVKRNCFEMRIATEAILEKDLGEFIGIYPKRRFKRLHEEYIRNHATHTMTLRFMPLEDELGQYRISLVYTAERPTELIPSLEIKTTSPKPSEVFLKICNLPSHFQFRCRFLFMYNRADKEVFPLPLRLEGDLFNEVRGMRLVKVQQDKIMWENSLDLVENDIMQHTVKFTHEGKCSPDLPQRLLERAVSFSRYFKR